MNAKVDVRSILGALEFIHAGTQCGEDVKKARAAVAELIEALQLCYDHCRLYHPDVEHNNVGDAVRAALAKATGADA